jgi:hypothetical protein
VFLIHDLEDKRFIQGKVMVPDSVTPRDIETFLDELEARMMDLLPMDLLLKEESVDG